MVLATETSHPPNPPTTIISQVKVDITFPHDGMFIAGRKLSSTIEGIVEPNFDVSELIGSSSMICTSLKTLELGDPFPTDLTKEDEALDQSLVSNYDETQCLDIATSSIFYDDIPYGKHQLISWIQFKDKTESERVSVTFSNTNKSVTKTPITNRKSIDYISKETSLLEWYENILIDNPEILRHEVIRDYSHRRPCSMIPEDHKPNTPYHHDLIIGIKTSSK